MGGTMYEFSVGVYEPDSEHLDDYGFPEDVPAFVEASARAIVAEAPEVAQRVAEMMALPPERRPSKYGLRPG
jgi:hypothetical protein